MKVLLLVNNIILPDGISQSISIVKCAFFLAIGSLSSNKFANAPMISPLIMACLPIAWPMRDRIFETRIIQ